MHGGLENIVCTTWSTLADDNGVYILVQRANWSPRLVPCQRPPRTQLYKEAHTWLRESLAEGERWSIVDGNSKLGELQCLLVARGSWNTAHGSSWKTVKADTRTHCETTPKRHEDYKGEDWLRNNSLGMSAYSQYFIVRSIWLRWIMEGTHGSGRMQSLVQLWHVLTTPCRVDTYLVVEVYFRQVERQCKEAKQFVSDGKGSVAVSLYHEFLMFGKAMINSTNNPTKRFWNCQVYLARHSRLPSHHREKDFWSLDLQISLPIRCGNPHVSRLCFLVGCLLPSEGCSPWNSVQSYGGASHRY